MDAHNYNPVQAIADAECSDDPIVQERILNEAIYFLEKNINYESDDYQYSTGYAWYLYPVSTELRNVKVSLYFENALRINPSHKLSLLYLGHHLYDLAQFAPALDIFMNLHPHEFLGGDQAWRDSKVSELILCCHLRLGNRENLSEALSRFCDSLTYCEPDMSPSPLELTRTLMAGIA